MDHIGSDNAKMGTGIAAVAARIQERAFQLKSELAAADVAEAELEEGKANLEAETKKNASIRRTLLSTVRSRHGVELELLRIQDEGEEHVRKKQRIQDNVRELAGKASALKDEWESVARNVYARHEMETELYKRREEGRVRRREERAKRRERKLDKLALKDEVCREEASSMHREREGIRDEIQEMDEREEREDEEIAAHAMQIKATLAKRVSLRDALQDAKELHKLAHEEMLRLKQECMQHSN